MAPPTDYESAFFQLSVANVAEESIDNPFDIVVIGSGIGGGVLASALLKKNARLVESTFNKSSTSEEKGHWNDAEDGETPVPRRILVIERGHLIFHTHSLNGPRPSISGTTSQGNDLFFSKFKHQWESIAGTTNWTGGGVYCLGGRAPVWGLFAPRFSHDTLDKKFPDEIRDTLLSDYYLKAEKVMRVGCPETKPAHQALIDRLNLKLDTNLPSTQWEWGRIASEFRNAKNYDFAAGGYSPIDTLLTAAMNDERDFRTILDAHVVRLEPEPEPGRHKAVTGIRVRDGTNAEHVIRCKKAVLCAGSIESAGILLRSVNEDTTKFGASFGAQFGHITDHRILSVVAPFFYRDMGDRNLIGGMKLQTDMQFNITSNGVVVDNSVAIANISLDTVSFLPRNDVSCGLLPMLVIAFILPSGLVSTNKVELNAAKDPRILFSLETDPHLEEKKDVMKRFAVDIMKKIVNVLKVRFVKSSGTGYTPLPDPITVGDIVLNESDGGVVAHELGTIPMSDKSGSGGLLDNNLKMKDGWNNVFVCDLSVFPYSPAANPTLTLAALALRLADELYPDPTSLPVTVYNLTDGTIYVEIVTSGKNMKKIDRTTIAPGESGTWRIETRGSLKVYNCKCAKVHNIQMVYPGTNAMIVEPPPVVPKAEDGAEDSGEDGDGDGAEDGIGKCTCPEPEPESEQ